MEPAVEGAVNSSVLCFQRFEDTKHLATIRRLGPNSFALSRLILSKTGLLFATSDASDPEILALRHQLLVAPLRWLIGRRGLPGFGSGFGQMTSAS